ncbi:MAG TPA: hypothetical protein VFG11_03970 [Acidobacteriota bacterium]|nr:hypothetical protein [Acidobacteriota bacterium]
MRYLQIRISKDSCLDKVLKEISRDVWLKIKEFLPAGEDSADSYLRLRIMISRAVHGRVHEYPDCGRTEACHDEIEGCPFLDYSDKIYMLSLDQDLERFISDVANQALNSILDELPIERKGEVFSLISRTFRHEFSKYLYFNPVCCTIPSCGLQLDESSIAELSRSSQKDAKNRFTKFVSKPA